MTDYNLSKFEMASMRSKVFFSWLEKLFANLFLYGQIKPRIEFTWEFEGMVKWRFFSKCDLCDRGR